MLAVVVAAKSTDAGELGGQLSLLCSGMEPVWKDRRRSEVPFEQRVVIDFGKRIYCLDACVETFPIKAIEGNRYVLREALEGGRHIDSIVVVREGETYRLVSSYEGTMRWRDGPCKRLD